MREIKFRAWDTETKEMSYDFLSKNWLRVCIESPYVELMQFVGLTDRNGKEIYEGDIVEVSRYDNDERYITKIDDIRRIPDILYGSAVNWREVMGNRFENPELINS